MANQHGVEAGMGLSCVATTDGGTVASQIISIGTSTGRILRSQLHTFTIVMFFRR